MNHLKKRNRKRKIFWRIITISVIGYFLYQVIKAPINNRDLRNNKVITLGTVIGASSNQRNTGGGLKYIFDVNGKQYKGSTGYSNLSINFCESVIGRNFPVIYSSQNIKNNQMLLTNEIFELYEMKQPDSLKWVENYILWK